MDEEAVIRETKQAAEELIERAGVSEE